MIAIKKTLPADLHRVPSLEMQLTLALLGPN